MKQILLTAALSSLMLSACTQPTTITVAPNQTTTYPGTGSSSSSEAPPVSFSPPDSAFRNPGNPERLLDRSSEQVTMSLSSKAGLDAVSNMIRRDPPTRATLSCALSDKHCAGARALLVDQGIPFEFDGGGSSVSLMYDRVVARDCDSRFVDNSRNSYNQYHPAFGCSVVANTIQMVGDKRQITNPSLMDFPDGSKAVQQYRRYSKPPKETKEKDGSVLKTISTSP